MVVLLDEDDNEYVLRSLPLTEDVALTMTLSLQLEAAEDAGSTFSPSVLLQLRENDFAFIPSPRISPMQTSQAPLEAKLVAEDAGLSSTSLGEEARIGTEEEEDLAETLRVLPGGARPSSVRDDVEVMQSGAEVPEIASEDASEEGSGSLASMDDEALSDLSEEDEDEEDEMNIRKKAEEIALQSLFALHDADAESLADSESSQQLHAADETAASSRSEELELEEEQTAERSLAKIAEHLSEDGCDAEFSTARESVQQQEDVSPHEASVESSMESQEVENQAAVPSSDVATDEILAEQHDRAASTRLPEDHLDDEYEDEFEEDEADSMHEKALDSPSSLQEDEEAIEAESSTKRLSLGSQSSSTPSSHADASESGGQLPKLEELEAVAGECPAAEDEVQAVDSHAPEIAQLPSGTDVAASEAAAVESEAAAVELSEGVQPEPQDDGAEVQAVDSHAPEIAQLPSGMDVAASEAAAVELSEGVQPEPQDNGAEVQAVDSHAPEIAQLPSGTDVAASEAAAVELAEGVQPQPQDDGTEVQAVDSHAPEIAQLPSGTDVAASEAAAVELSEGVQPQPQDDGAEAQPLESIPQSGATAEAGDEETTIEARLEVRKVFNMAEACPDTDCEDEDDDFAGFHGEIAAENLSDREDEELQDDSPSMPMQAAPSSKPPPRSGASLLLEAEMQVAKACAAISSGDASDAAGGADAASDGRSHEADSAESEEALAAPNNGRTRRGGANSEGQAKGSSSLGEGLFGSDSEDESKDEEAAKVLALMASRRASTTATRRSSAELTTQAMRERAARIRARCLKLVAGLGRNTQTGVSSQDRETLEQTIAEAFQNYDPLKGFAQKPSEGKNAGQEWLANELARVEALSKHRPWHVQGVSAHQFVERKRWIADRRCVRSVLHHWRGLLPRHDADGPVGEQSALEALLRIRQQHETIQQMQSQDTTAQPSDPHAPPQVNSFLQAPSMLLGDDDPPAKKSKDKAKGQPGTPPHEGQEAAWGPSRRGALIVEKEVPVSEQGEARSAEHLLRHIGAAYSAGGDEAVEQLEWLRSNMARQVVRSSLVPRASRQYRQVEFIENPDPIPELQRQDAASRKQNKNPIAVVLPFGKEQASREAKRQLRLAYHCSIKKILEKEATKQERFSLASASAPQLGPLGFTPAAPVARQPPPPSEPPPPPKPLLNEAWRAVYGMPLHAYGPINHPKAKHSGKSKGGQHSSNHGSLPPIGAAAPPRGQFAIEHPPSTTKWTNAGANFQERVRLRAPHPATHDSTGDSSRRPPKSVSLPALPRKQQQVC